MDALLGSNYFKKGLVTAGGHDLQMQRAAGLVPHDERVKAELRSVGLRVYELWSSESRYMQHVMYDDEHLRGAIFGRSEGTAMLLAATDSRVVLIDKKPLFTNIDEIGYDMIGGVSVSHAGIGSTVILHSSSRDYQITTLNRRTAERFVAYIESRCMKKSFPISKRHKPPLFSKYGQPRRIFR